MRRQFFQRLSEVHLPSLVYSPAVLCRSSLMYILPQGLSHRAGKYYERADTAKQALFSLLQYGRSQHVKGSWVKPPLHVARCRDERGVSTRLDAHFLCKHMEQGGPRWVSIWPMFVFYLATSMQMNECVDSRFYAD